MTTSFKDAMRIVVGGTVSSARTETDRVRFYRRFLKAKFRGAAREKKWLKTPGAKIVENIPIEEIPEPTDQEITERIAEEKRNGFDDEALERLNRHFKNWYPVLLSDRGRKGAKARHGEGNKLDSRKKGESDIKH